MNKYKLKQIKNIDNYLNEVGKYLLCFDRLRSKYTKLNVPFRIICKIDDAYGETRNWYFKLENDLEELKMRRSDEEGK